MRIDRFFIPNIIYSNNGYIICEGDIFHHIITVLRKKIGYKIILFDNSGFDYFCEIIHINKKFCSLNVKQKILNSNESFLHLILGQSVSNLSKFDFILQKSVELGVNQIYPIYSQFSDFKKNLFEKKQEHFQNIIISACEQSNRSKIPSLHSLTSLEDFILHVKDKTDLNIILHPYNIDKQFYIPNNNINSISFLIGPAGGFSDEEVFFALQNNFQMKKFGKRILRTETAPLVALSYAQFMFGDFQ